MVPLGFTTVDFGLQHMQPPVFIYLLCDINPPALGTECSELFAQHIPSSSQAVTQAVRRQGDAFTVLKSCVSAAEVCDEQFTQSMYVRSDLQQCL